MPDNLTTALIRAAATVIGAGFPVVANALAGRNRLYSSRGLSSMEGTWSGDGADFFTEHQEPKIPFKLTLHFQRKGRRITASGDLTADVEPRTSPMILEGGFFNDEYLQFNYRSKDPLRRQMGVIVFRLDGFGRELSGFYAGLSPGRGVFVVGSVSLKKITPETLP